MKKNDHSHFTVIKRPVITEKSQDLQIDNQILTFVVDPRATKIEIKEAVEKIWNVRVEHVRTVNAKGETRRNRNGKFTTRGKRKAYVKLKPGYDIELI